MGTAKLPEQINSRIEDARHQAEDSLDPHIKRLRATPVERMIEPEEVNVRRELSPGAVKGTRTIMRKLARGWKPKRKRKR